MLSVMLDFREKKSDQASTQAADFPCMYQIRWKNVDKRRNYGRKSKSKMAAVRQLGFRFFIIIQDNPRSLFIGPHQPAKFYANPIHSFADMAIWFFLQIWLEMPIHDPKISFFEGSEPLNVIGHQSSSRPTKGASLAGTALTCKFWYRSDQSTGATCTRDEGI